MDIVATKLFTLLRPELRRMQKKQNKQYRTISARLEKIEESLSAGFFLASNHTPKLDYLVNRVSADGDASATPNPPPPPLTIPTTNNTTEHIESAGLQPSYADILRLSKPEGQETTNKKPTKRDNSLSRVKRTITIARSDNGLPPVDPLTIRNTLNATLRDIQAPPNAIISTVTLNQKNNYIPTTREDCPASTVLQYKETLHSTLQNINNTTVAMKPQETWAKVAVHGINLLAYPDDTIGMELLQKEVETHNPGVTLYLFIYVFINHTAYSPRAMAGIERKTTITSSKADTRKQTVKLNKERKSPTEPLSTPICVLSFAYISFY